MAIFRSHLKIGDRHSERSEESPSASVRSQDSSSQTPRNDIFEIGDSRFSSYKDGAEHPRLPRRRRTLEVVGVIGLTCLLLLPLIPLGIWAFSQRWFFPAVLPTEWGLRAWAYIGTPGARLLEALGNSVLVALTVTALAIPCAIPAGRVLGLAHFRGKTFVEFLILAPTVVPSFATAMGIQVLFIGYGLADTHLGVILVHLVPVVPYAVLILAGTFANYDVDYENQARVLGARFWQIVWRVMLPAIRPGVVVAAMFAFLISWGQYLLTLLIGGGSVLTLPMLLLAFANSSDHSITAALSLVLLGPVLVVLLLSTRTLLRHDATDDAPYDTTYDTTYDTGVINNA